MHNHNNEEKKEYILKIFEDLPEDTLLVIDKLERPWSIYRLFIALRHPFIAIKLDLMLLKIDFNIKKLEIKELKPNKKLILSQHYKFLKKRINKMLKEKDLKQLHDKDPNKYNANIAKIITSLEYIQKEPDSRYYIKTKKVMDKFLEKYPMYDNLLGKYIK